MLLPRRARLAAVAAVLAFCAVGCGGAYEQQTMDTHWSFISATITEPSCATVNCHSAISQRAGVDLHDAASGYKSLVGGVYVIPSHADQSSLTNVWLTNAAPLRMPPDNPLPDVDVQIITAWINAGAPNN